MRRYWQPVAVQRDFPVGSPPTPVRLLGEDLVLFRECNYHQGNEGNFDPHHVPLLHWTANGSLGTVAPLGPNRRWLKPVTEIEETEFGVRLYSVQATPDGGTQVGTHHFIMPNLSAF